MASVIAAEAAKMARMAVGAFIDVFSVRSKAGPRSREGPLRAGEFPDLAAPRA